jgi:hypothetical protein
MSGRWESKKEMKLSDNLIDNPAIQKKGFATAHFISGKQYFCPLKTWQKSFSTWFLLARMLHFMTHTQTLLL